VVTTMLRDTVLWQRQLEKDSRETDLFHQIQIT